MNLNDIYSELILEHSKNTLNHRHLDKPDKVENGHNPSCGDEIALELKYDGDVIKDASFTGHGCAISQASASMMIDDIKGKTKMQAIELANMFIAMIKKEITDDKKLEALGDAIVLKNISNLPARVKCAELAWYTLKLSLQDDKNSKGKKESK